MRRRVVKRHVNIVQSEDRREKRRVVIKLTLHQLIPSIFYITNKKAQM